MRTTFLVIVGLTTVCTTEEYELNKLPSRFGVARSVSDDNSTDPEPKVVYWIPTPCDSLFERGYTCYSCGEALHCMLGNVGLLALCYGRRPYCNNGVCSDIPSQKCQAEAAQHNRPYNSTQIIQPVPGPANIQPAPIQPLPNLTPIQQEPSLTPIQSEPIPAPVQSMPNPTPIQSVLSPANLQPEPTLAPIQSVPTQT